MSSIVQHCWLPSTATPILTHPLLHVCAQGRSYYCKHVDLDSRVALVAPADVRHYTKVRDYCDVHVTGGKVAYPTAGAALAAIAARGGDAATAHLDDTRSSSTPAATGSADAGQATGGDIASQSSFTTATCESCLITVRFLGYHRVAQGSGRIIDTVELFLPDTQFETQVRYIATEALSVLTCTP